MVLVFIRIGGLVSFILHWIGKDCQSAQTQTAGGL
jgi:hypothetical protein